MWRGEGDHACQLIPSSYLHIHCMPTHLKFRRPPERRPYWAPSCIYIGIPPTGNPAHPGCPVGWRAYAWIGLHASILLSNAHSTYWYQGGAAAPLLVFAIHVQSLYFPKCCKRLIHHLWRCVHQRTTEIWIHKYIITKTTCPVLYGLGSAILQCRFWTEAAFDQISHVGMEFIEWPWASENQSM